MCLHSVSFQLEMTCSHTQAHTQMRTLKPLHFGAVMAGLSLLVPGVTVHHVRAKLLLGSHSCLVIGTATCKPSSRFYTLSRSRACSGLLAYWGFAVCLTANLSESELFQHHPTLTFPLFEHHYIQSISNCRLTEMITL